MTAAPRRCDDHGTLAGLAGDDGPRVDCVLATIEPQPGLTALSGPWQAKQFAMRIGRMSVVFEAICAAAGRAARENVAEGATHHIGILYQSRRASTLVNDGRRFAVVWYRLH